MNPYPPPPCTFIILLSLLCQHTPFSSDNFVLSLSLLRKDFRLFYEAWKRHLGSHEFVLFLPRMKLVAVVIGESLGVAQISLKFAIGADGAFRFSRPVRVSGVCGETARSSARPAQKTNCVLGGFGVLGRGLGSISPLSCRPELRCLKEIA